MGDGCAAFNIRGRPGCTNRTTYVRKETAVTYPFVALTTRSPHRAQSLAQGFGVHDLDGLGLSEAVRNEIVRRVATVAASRPRPFGGCLPFTNPERAIAYVHDRLVYRGYRPSTTVKVASNPRELVIDGIQEGKEMGGFVVKTGAHQIAISVAPLPTPGQVSGPRTPQRFTVPFTP
jgi:hypothetical protein